MKRILFILLTLAGLTLAAGARADAPAPSRAEAVLELLLAQPPHVTDRELSPSERRQGLLPVARALDLATRDDFAGLTPDLQLAAVLSVGWHESRWALYVAQGRCLEGPPGSRCDLDRHGVPRARGPWQLWRVACGPAWLFPSGSWQSLQLEARCAVRQIVGAYWRCRGQHPSGDDWAGAFSGYRSVSCTWPAAVKRSHTMRRLLPRVRAMEG